MLRPPKAFISWSSGKDSAFALHEARRTGAAEIVGVLTTLNEVYGRVAMHGVRDSVLDRQIAALGLPALKVMLPDPCSNQIYQQRMARACERLLLRRLGREFAGRRFDRNLLEELPPDVDPCAENGEFHTLVSAGPMFAAPVQVSVAGVLERDGFVFADVTVGGPS